VALLVQPGEVGAQDSGREPLGREGGAGQLGLKELDGLGQVLAVGLDRVGGRVPLQGEVSEVVGQQVVHEFVNAGRRVGYGGPVSAGAASCSRAFRISTEASNQVRLSRGSAAWSRT